MYKSLFNFDMKNLLDVSRWRQYWHQDMLQVGLTTLLEIAIQLFVIQASQIQFLLHLLTKQQYQ